MSTTDTLYAAVQQQMKAQAYAAVIDQLTDAELETHEDWRLYWSRAWCHVKTEDSATALSYFLKALRHTQRPADRATCLTFAGIAALSSEKAEAATNYLVQSLTLEDRALTRKYLALAHAEQGAIEAAERVHTSGIQKAPQDKSRLAAYGDFLLDQGRVEEAQTIRQQLDELD